MVISTHFIWTAFMAEGHIFIAASCYILIIAEGCDGSRLVKAEHTKTAYDHLPYTSVCSNPWLIVIDNGYVTIVHKCRQYLSDLSTLFVMVNSAYSFSVCLSLTVHLDCHC